MHGQEEVRARLDPCDTGRSQDLRGNLSARDP